AAQAAAPLFVEAIKSPDPRTRWDAIWYLHQLPRPEVVIPNLGALLQDPTPGVRASAAESLGNIGPEAENAIPMIAKLLQDPVPAARLAAAQAISLIGIDDLAVASAAAVPLIEVFTSTDPAVPLWLREDAEWYLGRLQPKDKVAVPVYIGMLKDKKAVV